MFVEEILDNIAGIIRDLKDSQIQTFYEAVGHMISSHHDVNVKHELIARLMFLPNQTVHILSLSSSNSSLKFLSIRIEISTIVCY
jgi:exportin-1